MKHKRNTILALFILSFLLCLCACSNDSSTMEETHVITTIDDIHLNNEYTETDKKSELKISDEIFDFTFIIDGTVYQLPAQLSDFKESGWNYPYDKNPEDKDVFGENTESSSFENNNGKIQFSVINQSGNTKKFIDCKIGSIEHTYTQWSNCNIELSKGLVLKGTLTTMQDVIDKWGEPTQRFDNRLEYEKDTHIGYYFMFDEDGGIISIDISNWSTIDDDKTNSVDRPEYLDDYVEPETLTNNFFSYTFNLDGKLYNLPAPVSEFINDGWVITDKVEYVAANQGVSAGIRIRKNDNEILLGIKNFSDYQVNAEDTMVTSLLLDICDVYTFECSGGIKLGMSQEAFENNINLDLFERYTMGSSGEVKYDFSEYTNHAYFTFSSEGVLTQINFGNEVLLN